MKEISSLGFKFEPTKEVCIQCHDGIKAHGSLVCESCMRENSLTYVRIESSIKHSIKTGLVKA